MTLQAIHERKTEGGIDTESREEREKRRYAQRDGWVRKQEQKKEWKKHKVSRITPDARSHLLFCDREIRLNALEN